MTISPYVPPTFLTALPTGIWSGTQSLPVFPFLPGQTPNVAKSPLWSTEVITSASGRKRATEYWPYPLWNFELSYEVIRHKPTKDELFTLWEFFNVAKGRGNIWLFVDPDDCQVLSTTPASFGTGDGSTQSFQLQRQLNSFSEPVFDVYSPTVLDNGAAAGAYTIAPNGLITFTTAPAAGHALTWYGYFYFGCRFLQDDMSFEQMVPTLWSGKSVKFQSERA